MINHFKDVIGFSILNIILGRIAVVYGLGLIAWGLRGFKKWPIPMRYII